MKNAVLMLWFILCAYSMPAQTTIEGEVTEVIEGDIIKVVSGDETILVKLRNIECPELAQEYGVEAKEFTEKSCLNRKVTVVFQGYDRDRNALGTVTTHRSKDLGYELIERGLAWHFVKGLQLGPDSSAYMELEQEVKKKGKGLWKKPDPVAPWIFRAHQNRWEGKTSM